MYAQELQMRMEYIKHGSYIHLRQGSIWGPTGLLKKEPASPEQQPARSLNLIGGHKHRIHVPCFKRSALRREGSAQEQRGDHRCVRSKEIDSSKLFCTY